MLFSETSLPISSTESASNNFLKSLHEIVKCWATYSDIIPERLADEIDEMTQPEYKPKVLGWNFLT